MTTEYKKRGKLSKEEEKFILDNKDTLTLEQIAEQINRTVEPVQSFLERKALEWTGITPEASADQALRAKLHSRPYWQEVRSQFSKADNVEELQYFERVWIALMRQFKEDVLMTEELQMKQWITLDILMNRSMAERKENIEEIEKLKAYIDSQMKLPKEDREQMQLAMSEQNLQFLRGQVSSYTSDHMKILAQIEKIQKDLKATRVDRIKRIEDGKTSFVGLITQLEDEDERERFGIEAEVMSRAVTKSQGILAALHTYEDGKVDQPFLNSETVLLGDDDNGEEES